MRSPSQQLDELWTILMTLPLEMQRMYAKQRNRKGAFYSLLSELTFNTTIPIFTIFRLNEWRKWEKRRTGTSSG